MNPIKSYARFVSHNPVWMLIIVIVVSLIALFAAGNVGTKSMEQRDVLPDDLKVMESFDKIEDNFGSPDTMKISVEISPENKHQFKDIRNPEIISYLYVLSEMSGKLNEVLSSESAGSVLKGINGGNLPKSKRDIIEMVDENPILENYISSDYEMGIVEMRLTSDYEEEEIVNKLQNIVEQTERPDGLEVNVAGDIAAQIIVEDLIQDDMQKTSMFSIIGILIVLFLLFFSIRYALTPLTVIILGVLWAFGFMGLMSMNMSPQTSGAMSMIMGIGIDFGIQTITRFREELKDKTPALAMETTINNVFKPMATTTVAALIGFRAMSMGDISILAELGTIMSYGVTACFLAAITFVPVISVLGERLFRKKYKLRSLGRS